jgi:hypothetical protein
VSRSAREDQIDRLYETLRSYVSEKRLLSRLKRALERDRHSTLPSGYDFLTDEAAIRRTLGEYPRDRYREACQRAVKSLDTAVISLFELEAALHFLELKADTSRGYRDLPVCSVEGCDAIHHSKGLCVSHYRRSRWAVKHGT